MSDYQTWRDNVTVRETLWQRLQQDHGSDAPRIAANLLYQAHHRGHGRPFVAFDELEIDVKARWITRGIRALGGC